MNRIFQGDAISVLKSLPDESVQTCVTSPPYFGLRDYGVEGQIGLEDTPAAYVARLVEIFQEVKRVLRNDGTLWLNLGDSYAGSWGAQSRPNGNDIKSLLQDGSMLSARQIAAHPKRTHTGSLKNTPGLKNKDLIGIPWRVAFALQADGWYLRQDIIWHKPNPMPESVKDRCTRAHEYIFMLSKSERYYYDSQAIAEPCVSKHAFRFVDGGEDKQRGHTRRHAGFNGRYKERILREGAPVTRNRRSVWSVTTKPYKGAHFATFPPDLIEPCILAGAPPGGVVIDPFLGSGTTAAVALSLGREYVGIELNPAYVVLAETRLSNCFNLSTERRRKI